MIMVQRYKIVFIYANYLNNIFIKNNIKLLLDIIVLYKCILNKIYIIYSYMQIFNIIFLYVLQHIIFLTKVIVYSKKSITFASVS